MQKDYKINFKVGADSKGLDDLSNKATQAERRFFGLENNIKGVGITVGTLTASLAGLSGALGMIELANKTVETVSNAKANIVDLKNHEYASKHIVRFMQKSNEFSSNYKLGRSDVEAAFYKASQNKDSFLDEKDIVNFVELMAQYSKATGKDIVDKTEEMLDLKKMGNFSTDTMKNLLDQITAYEDRYGIKQGDLFAGLKGNLEFLSDGTDPEKFIGMYADLVQKSGSTARANKTVQSFLIKRDELKKGMKIEDTPLGQLLDRKGISAEEFKKMDDSDALRLLVNSLDLNDDKEMELFSEALGTKEARKLKNKKIQELNKNTYANNLEGEVKKARQKEGIFDKAKYGVSKFGTDAIRTFSKQDTYSAWEDLEENKLYAKSLENQGLYRNQIDQKMQEKYKQDINNIDNSKTNVENNIIINEASDADIVAKKVNAEIAATFKKVDNTLKDRNNLE